MLTENLATKMVKRTMAILNANVNIMDSHGIIIGSGDKTRLGQIHTGARKVIEQQTTVEINEEESREWRGTLPGINLPIRFQDEVVGVIGITGKPEEIRNYSQLVQMGAELILEQEYLTKEIQRNERIREDILSHLLLGSEQELDYILERAQFLNIDIEHSYAVILLSPLTEHEAENLQKIERWIWSWIDKEDELVRLYTTQYVILKKKRPSINTNEHLTSFINQKLSKSTLPRLNIAIGPFSEDIHGWRSSFREAQTILGVSEALYPNGGLWKSDDLLVEIMCYKLWKSANDEAEKKADLYKRLFNENEGEMLHETLLTYIRENGKVATTAQKLFIHRNTLTYRLNKIHQVTGKDPKDLQDLLELYISQILYRLLLKNKLTTRQRKENRNLLS